MKIHVAQKGETLRELAQQYGVDFDELKKENSHLSDPDKVMPGMKIKIPTHSKLVRKEDKKKNNEAKQPPLEKEMKKIPTKDTPEVKTPYKDTSKKATPVMKEDDHKKPMKEKEKLPMKPVNIPNLPPLENEGYGELNIPEVPQYQKEKISYQNAPYQPASIPSHQVPSPPTVPVNPHYGYQQVAPPVQYYPSKPCCGSHKPTPNVPYALQKPVQHVQNNPAQVYPAQPHYQMTNPGVSYPEGYGAGTPYQTQPFHEDVMESSSSLEMPQMPSHLAGMYQQDQSYKNGDIPGTYPGTDGVSSYGLGYPNLTSSYPQAGDFGPIGNSNPGIGGYSPFVPTGYPQGFNGYMPGNQGYLSPGYGAAQPYPVPMHGTWYPEQQGYNLNQKYRHKKENGGNE
ncbi:LysM peptidoglycan-binding domain-containing protein [Aquibacillus salsiterrae]|uniref:LysM peptidoglycan-binding domain-containing protein n=1 Tax=Aquibacillus salsiterrae TaxID=2950439 RepID=A0A9X3WEM7_9BACI|nr:LysM peptidoglycan-binding domain-containing protein [Aquibacillus salsiterrae]MDC3415651.1 LysM peptidoglycan-binding domain-containing protein [Aquibacillus salsiterrae]